MAIFGIVLISILWLLPAGSLLEARFTPPTTTEVAMVAIPPDERVEEAPEVAVEVVEEPEKPVETSRLHIAYRYAAPNDDAKYQWMREAGVPESQQSCAYTLIARESGWRVQAINLSSGAYGLPQSLPGNKMASAGADWETNPVTQLRWMISYVNSRYGGFCQALAHSDINNWY